MSGTAVFLYAYDPCPEAADRQLQGARRHCAAAGLTVAGEFCDGGALAQEVPLRDRPGGRDLLARLTPGTGVVVASPLALASSLTRFAALTTALCEVGVAVHVAPLDAGPVSAQAGEQLARFLQVAAALGPAGKSEQVRVGMLKAKLAGRRVSRHAPPGFRWEWRGRGFVCVPDEHELQVIQGIVRWRRLGYSWLEISRHLLEHQTKTASGGTWCPRRCRKAHSAALAGKIPLEMTR